MSGDWRETLRERGYRLTPQRELILDAVDTLAHATPDEVLAEVRKHSSALNFFTVYRTLEVLEELGLVRHAHLSDRAPTYHSARLPAHVHLVCRRCHRIEEASHEQVHDFAESLLGSHGFTADIGHLTVFGVCKECSAADPSLDQ